MEAMKKPRARGPVSDHFNGKTFFSPYGMAPKGFLDLLRWQWAGGREAWPKEVVNKTYPPLPTKMNEGETFVTFVNHASLLLQWPGANLLTDPVWSPRVSPLSFAGPRRIRQPGLAFEKLPKIDFVLVSHNHYDHLDEPTIQRLVKKHDPLFFIALGDGVHFQKIRGARYQEMDWWETVSPQAGLKIHYLPAQHWSARGLHDRNRSLWGSFFIEGAGASVYFAGDSGYSRHFAEIASRFPSIDLALLPIGAYEPRWFMKEQHMNPADAVRAHQDLKARKSLGIHFGTWQLTDEGFQKPTEDLARALAESGISTEDFLVFDQGEGRFFHRAD